MNIIKIKVDFAKRRIEKEGVKLTEGDYNSTKLLFEFNVENQDGRKVFELAKPDTDEAIFVQEIVDNEVILVGKAEVKDEHGYIKYVDQEENIYWYDAENNKVYDAEYQEQEIRIETLTKVLVDASIFDEEGSYPFEISLYDGDSKLTSAYSSLKVAKEMVKIGEERISTYMPIFDQLMQQIQEAINETNTLNISVEREGDTAIITITKKDGTTEVVRISGGGGGGGTFNHADLDNLDYEHSGHTGFQEEIDDLDDIRSGANAGATAVQDNNYVHTDNNYTTQEKTKLAGLNNYDDTALSGRVANAEYDIDNLETTVAGHTTAIGNKQDKLTSTNAGNNVTITEVDGVMKINSTGGSDSIHTKSYTSGNPATSYITHCYFYSSKPSNGGDFNTDVFKDILEKAYNDAIAHYDTTVDENITKIFFMNEGSINILSIRLSGTFTGTKYCKYFQYASENCMQSQVQFTATLTDGVYVLSDLGYRNSQRNLIALATGNTIAYTPTSDYNPATKKYVDDITGNINTVLENIINGGV